MNNAPNQNATRSNRVLPFADNLPSDRIHDFFGCLSRLFDILGSMSDGEISKSMAAVHHSGKKLPEDRATWDKLKVGMLRSVSRAMFPELRKAGSLSHIGTKCELVELFIRRGVSPSQCRRAYRELFREEYER